MTLRLAIVADDLTGALDTATPFVLAGLTVAVAVDVGGITEALEAGTDVVAVSTASRALPPDRAAAKVRDAGRALLAARPEILFKKVDSRLKGNVGAETEALAELAGFRRLVVAPAIPDQQRLVLDGAVTGRGVDVPLPVAPLFAGTGRDVAVADSRTDADIERLVDAEDWSSALAVGARGLGLAFARRLAAGGTPAAFVPTERTLFGIGSRDPITAAQIDRLLASGAIRAVLDAPAGTLPPASELPLPALARCTGPLEEDTQAVASRFGVGVARLVLANRPDMLMLGGGDTALAVLAALGVRAVFPRGEIEPGVPWFEMRWHDGESLACSVKSGGFGTTGTLLGLMPPSRASLDGKPEAGVSS
jgi:uncharacterized protein YgbK (DUF1537 family)